MKMTLMKLMMRLRGRMMPGRMSCHQVGEDLQSYLDDHVDAERADRISAHLDACRRCGMTAATYDRIKVALAAQQPEVPRESIDRLREFGRQLVEGENPTVR